MTERAKPELEAGATPEGIATVQAQKRRSVLQLLFRCARLANEQALARVRAQPGMEGLRASHTNLFPHIDFAGTRLTELARRVGISKQAVAQLVDELEGMGAVERVADPADGRAKLIRFRAKDGVPVFSEGLALLMQFEGELASSLGAQRVRELHQILSALDAHLDPQA